MIVGDTETDIRASKAIGSLTVALLTGIRTRDHVEVDDPDVLQYSLVEIVPLVGRVQIGKSGSERECS